MSGEFNELVGSKDGTAAGPGSAMVVVWGAREKGFEVRKVALNGGGRGVDVVVLTAVVWCYEAVQTDVDGGCIREAVVVEAGSRRQSWPDGANGADHGIPDDAGD